MAYKSYFKEADNKKLNIESEENLYLYLDIWDERDNFEADLKNVDGKILWSWSYSTDEDGFLTDSSPVDDGYMRNWQDTRGLEKYLKSLKVISKKANIFRNENEAEKQFKRNNESFKECDCESCNHELDEDQKRCDDLGREKGRKYKYDGGTCTLQSCGSGEVWNDDRTRCVKKESKIKEEGRGTIIAPNGTVFLKVANSDKVKNDISNAGFPVLYLYNMKVKYVLFLINQKDLPTARKIKGVKDFDSSVSTIGEWKPSPFSDGANDSELLSKFKSKNGR